MLLFLDMEGVKIASGSACISRSLKVSHVMLAMGIDAGTAQGSLLMTLGSDNTDQDVDDFLKILLTQLSHQDPTQPLEDKDFVAQMAQFSSLEQMTNIGEGFKQLNEILASGRALNLLGKKVEVASGNQSIEGIVKAVSGNVNPQLLVNGSYYNYSDVQKVME